ncbi:Protein LDB19 [Yarrowia sp. B02]|nr:Protein LDB19 [Yarrowia sp. B02]
MSHKMPLLSRLSPHHSPAGTPPLKPVQSPSLAAQLSNKVAGSSSKMNTGTASTTAPAQQNQPYPPSSVPVPVKLSFRIESPPLVLFGPRQESTGAILNGLFNLEIKGPDAFPMKSVQLAIVQEIKVKRGIPGLVPSEHTTVTKTGAARTTELAKWDILQIPTPLPPQNHVYPFSHLLPGEIPGTTDCPLFSINYKLHAVAVPDPASGYTTPFVLTQPLNVSRSIIRGQDRTSIRVFPPTDLNASMVLPNVIYPKSSFTLELKLEGVTTPAKNARWKMRKVNWRIDETIRFYTKVWDPNFRETPRRESATAANGDIPASGAPAEESPRLSTSGTAATATGAVNQDRQERSAKKEKKLREGEIEEVRTVGSGEIKSGWKSNFDGKGVIELLGDVSTHNLGQLSCNLDDPVLGLLIKHVLVVELVVAEEASPTKSSKQSIPTGAARVLRMQFNLVITDRSGLGIAWDDEVPPTYEDVPLSPPDYDNVASLPKLEEVQQPELSALSSIHSSLHSRELGHFANSLPGSRVGSPMIRPSEGSSRVGSPMLRPSQPGSSMASPMMRPSQPSSHMPSPLVRPTE